jgi:DNA (cytosine-5)-methyltransferase 1
MIGEVQQIRENGIPKSWILRTSNGMAERMDRTIAIGNEQVPLLWHEIHSLI